MKLYSNKYNAIILSLCVVFAACSDEIIDPNNPNAGKSPIELYGSSGGEVMPFTRAEIIDGNGKVTAFEKNTRLTLLMVSKDAATTPTADKYALTYGLAIGSGKAPGASDAPATSSISFATTKTADKQVYTDPTNVNPEADTPIPTSEADGSMRFWDDAHGRTSKLSIYGFAVNNTILPLGAPWNQKVNGEANNANFGWKALPNDYNYTIGREDGSSTAKWKVGDQRNNANYNSQSFKSLLYKDDISYSNNISGTNQMQFGKQTTGKFDSGVLTFNRAMSMLSFKVTVGGGFDATKADNFKFETGTNIALKGFNKEGYLDIKEGKWKEESIGTDAIYHGKTGYSWNKIANVTEGKTINQIDDHTYYLLALVIPGTDIKNSTEAEAVTMIIDGNEYKISMKQLYDAIIANKSTWKSGWTDKDVFDKLDTETEYVRLKPGINYEFSFTIGKTAIDKISAQLVDWTNVVAQEFSPKNTYITLDLKNNEGTLLNEDTPVFDLYRSTATSPTIDSQFKDWNWEKGYNESAELTHKTGSLYETKWYWPNNKTFYHLRTVNKGAHINTGTSIDNEYVSIFSGPINDTYTAVTTDISSNYKDGKYNDFKWGAPFKKQLNNQDYTITYSPETGFCNNATKENGQIYYAIGPTESTINFTQFHMMSNIYVHLVTTESTDPNHIDLSTITFVKLYNFAQDAKLYVGNGLVTGYSTYCTAGEEMTHHTSHVDVTGTPGYEYSFRVVPQSVSAVNDNKKSIVITTEAGNLFTIDDLSQIKIKDETGNYIDPWQPGKSYFYTFKLTKKGIDPIQVTEVDWKNVEANPEDVQIQ